MSQSANESTKGGDFYGCVARIFWMLFGNGILVLTFFSILSNNNNKFISTSDFIFFATVILLIIVRFIDIKRLNGKTSSGEPATMGHWKKYTLFLILGSAAMWILAHIGAYYKIV